MDWKLKIKNSCSCEFTACKLSCSLLDIKNLLKQDKKPINPLFCQAMIKSNIFTKREIAFALCELRKISLKSSNRRIEEAVVELKKEKYQIFTDENSIIKAYKNETN